MEYFRSRDQNGRRLLKLIHEYQKKIRPRVIRKRSSGVGALADPLLNTFSEIISSDWY